LVLCDGQPRLAILSGDTLVSLSLEGSTQYLADARFIIHNKNCRLQFVHRVILLPNWLSASGLLFRHHIVR